MPQSPDPTPEEIAAECAGIRAGWHEQEEQKRRRWAIAPPVEVVAVETGGVGE